ncbi:GNAT family N-acetyltransferase [candidate division KSB1 bacterium]
MLYNIDVKKMKKSDTGEWDRFVNDSENGTIFHLQKFLGYHPKNRFINCHLMFRYNKQLIGVIPGTEKYIDGKKIFVSHPGVSFGGLVFKNDISLFRQDSVIKSMLNYFKKNIFNEVYITCPPLPYMKSLCESINFFFYSNGLRIIRKELSSVIPLSYTSKDDILKSFRRSTRGSYRKAVKSEIYTEESNDVDTFYPILKTVKDAYKVNPAHSLSELKKLLKLFPDRIKLFGTFHKKKLIGGIVFFLCDSTNALIFYNIIDKKYQLMKPANFQVYKVIEYLWERGYKELDFGISTIDMDPNIGLIRFKMGFGARNYARNYYYIEL